jgi:hypothetical protein
MRNKSLAHRPLTCGKPLSLAKQDVQDAPWLRVKVALSLLILPHTRGFMRPSKFVMRSPGQSDVRNGQAQLVPATLRGGEKYVGRVSAEDTAGDGLRNENRRRGLYTAIAWEDPRRRQSDHRQRWPEKRPGARRTKLQGRPASSLLFRTVRTALRQTQTSFEIRALPRKSSPSARPRSVSPEVGVSRRQTVGSLTTAVQEITLSTCMHRQ